MATENRIACPIDDHVEGIQKVSAVIGQRGRVTGTRPVSHTYSDSEGKVHSYTSHIPFSDLVETGLQKNLALGEEPEEPLNNPGCVRLISLLFFVGSGGSVIYYFVGNVLNQLIQDDTTLSLSLIILLSVIVYLVFIFMIPPFKEKTEKIYEEEIQKWEKKMVTYNNKFKIWDNWYYCHRHDLVFTPGEEKTLSPNEVQLYLSEIE